MSAVALVLVQVITLLQTLVLARLLSPREVGLFAAGTVLATFLMTFAEGALTQALIQRPDGAPGRDGLDDVADTVFWATLAGGLAMSLLTLAAAPLIALLFGHVVAGTIAAVTAGAMVLHSLTSVPDALMQRRFDFRRRLVIDPLTALTFAVVSVVFAGVGYGVWSLVIGSYAQMTVWVVLSWGLAGWRPGRGRPSLRLWRQLARFGFPLLVASVAERLRDVVELTVVGRALDTASLGFYRYGRRIAMLPGSIVIQAGAFVLFPAFARIADDPVRLKQAFLRALTWIWLAALPVAGVLVAVGEQLAVLLLGEPWRGAGVAVTAMAGVGLGQALSAVSVEVLKGTGRSERINWMTASGLLAGLGLVLLLVPFGLFGVGLAVSGTAVVVGLVGLSSIRDVVGVTGLGLLRLLLPPAAAAVVATTVVAIAEHVLLRADVWPVGLGLVIITGEVIVLGVAYIGLLALVAPEPAGRLLAAVRQQLAERMR
jgi:PST family polysaccharide transporter